MADIEKVINGIRKCLSHKPCNENGCLYENECAVEHLNDPLLRDALELLKEKEKKEIKLHKKHVITLKRNDEFTTRKLYEAVCETLMDDGELVIVRIDDHEKVDFTFYVTHEDT